jgi:hypothetical protein
MTTDLKTGEPFRGTSKGAKARREVVNRGVLHNGRPGEVIEMSRDRKYRVAADGSFRRFMKEQTA